MKRKYTIKEFIVGLITNVVFKFYYLAIAAAVCLLVGSFNIGTLYVGLVLLGTDIVLSLINQLSICHTAMTDSSDKI